MENELEDSQTEYDDDLPSKSSLKRALKARQVTIQQWAALSATQIKKLPLDEALIEALLKTHTMRADSGRRRLMRWAAKQIDDQDVLNVAAALEQTKQAVSQAVAREQLIEDWRTRLLSEKTALTEFCNAYPATEVQPLRQIIRQCEHKTEIRRTTAKRTLFKLIREHINAADPLEISSPENPAEGPQTDET